MVEQITTLLDLPIELRDNIVARLDIEDILSLSLSCRLLRAILETRQTWMRLAQEIQLQPQVSKMEEPLEDFTTQELRDWTIRRHKIRHCFDSGSRAACHNILGTHGVETCVLLPGGRWLLFERSPGKIFYADCDAPRHEVQSLITLEDVVPDHSQTKFVVWRDPDSPRLTFRVAFLYSYYPEHEGDDSDEWDHQAYFCKINLIGHGSSAKLVAERIHLYQGGFPSSGRLGEAIRGEHFYQRYGILSSPYNRQITLMRVINYGNGSSVAHQVRLVGFSHYYYRCRLEVLPDGRIAIVGAYEIAIYPNPLSIVGNEMTTLTPSLVIEGVGYGMHNGSVHMSEWYFGLESTMAVYGASSKQMITVWIPHDGTSLMKGTIKEHMPYSTARCICLGLFHGIVMDSRDCMRILSYHWGGFQDQTDSGGMTGRTFIIERDQDDGTCGVGRIRMDYPRRYPHPWDVLYFNEELGRAIIWDQDRGYSVVDIVV